MTRDMTRSPRILAYCSQPRKMHEIIAQFGSDDAKRIRETVHQLAHRKKLINAGTAQNEGLWIRPECVQQPKPVRKLTALGWARGLHLQSVWGMRPAATRAESTPGISSRVHVLADDEADSPDDRRRHTTDRSPKPRDSLQFG